MIPSALFALAVSVLPPGVTLRDAIGRHDSVQYTIRVPANTAASIEVTHRGVYTVTRLIEDGKRIDLSDDSNGDDGEEFVVAPIRDRNAEYDVVIVPIVHNSCGEVETTLRFDPVDERARTLDEAHRKLFEARRLEMVGDAKSAEASNTTFDDAIALAKQAGELRTLSEAILRSSIVLGQVSRTEDAIARIEQGIPLFHDLGYIGVEGRALDRRGELYRRIGDVAAAERDLKAALPLVEAARAYEGIADTRNNLGLVYEQTGRWDDAIKMYADVIPLTPNISIDTASAVRSNLGSTYTAMGDYPAALEVLKYALEMKRSQNIPRRTSQTLHVIALVQVAMSELDKARATLNEAMALAEKAGDPTLIGQLYATLGRLGIRQKRYDDAAEAFRQSLERSRAVKDRRAEGRTLTSFATVELERGNVKEAGEMSARAVELAHDVADNVNEAAALYAHARVRQMEGNLADALSEARKAVDIVDSIRAAIVNPDLRSTYLSTLRKYFDLVIELQMLEHERNPSGGFAAEAFRTNERSRARTLLESLARAQANVVKGVPPELVTRMREVRRELDAKQAYHATLLRNERRTELRNVETRIATLLSEERELGAKIRASSPDYAALEFPEPPAPADIQSSLLDHDTTLVEYHLGRDRSYVWVISKQKVRVEKLPNEATVEKLALRYRDLLLRDPETLYPESAEKMRKDRVAASHALAKAVWRPVGAIKGKVLIVPDGALSYVPFAALPDAEGQPLLVAHEISYLPSATLLATLRRSTRAAEPLRSVAVFADPVFQRTDPRFGASKPAADATPRDDERYTRGADLRRLRFSGQEAEAVLSAADRTKSLEALGFRATKQAMTSADLRRFGTLHVATHGIVNAEEPDKSGLVFSRYDQKGRRIDGFLKLGDIYNLDLDADLVVLSACQTAIGKSVFGEGMISLTRGFMYGGAKRVMATLWSVDDRGTAKLMAQMYESMLQKHEPPARALREAQLAMLRNPRWSDPYYWAAFTLHGER
ncbi:MAG: CHAT domain-containing protein [Acidobacteria bacterium]|nr:CHAT domain-containing protein [Acidobacteriota bacterium]